MRYHTWRREASSGIRGIAHHQIVIASAENGRRCRRVSVPNYRWRRV